MALAVLFLLLGALAAEIALFGFFEAALVGAVFLFLSAVTMVVVARSRAKKAQSRRVELAQARQARAARNTRVA